MISCLPILLDKKRERAKSVRVEEEEEKKKKKWGGFGKEEKLLNSGVDG
jgi:hypothetical protein